MAINHKSSKFKTIDENGKTDKAFAIAGYNDTEASQATTIITTPGFKANEHPHECLTFYFYIQVVKICY